MPYSVKHDTDLVSSHTFKLLGSTCECFVEYNDAHDLPLIFNDPSLPHPILPIGGGSNMFFNGHFRGTVLHCTNSDVTIDGPSMTAGPAATLDNICHITAGKGLWGAECLSGIPGEICGAIVQNAGAYGAETADIVDSVDVYDIAGNRFITLSKNECRFGYRTSMFKDTCPTEPQYIITGVHLSFHNQKPQHQQHRGIEITPDSTPESVRQSVLRLRDSKLPDPTVTGSAGSFFKNPVISKELFNRIQASETTPVPSYAIDGNTVKIPAAWLIDHCGLKGVTHGGAAVWHKQPLVLVNLTGTATASDIMTLSNSIISQVFERYGVSLEREVICVD